MAVPDHLVAEIIDGELVVSPRPAPRHARAASVLGSMLLEPFDRGRGGPGGWWILDEPGLHLFGKAEPLVPDLAGWRVERVPDLPETAYFALAPDWVCEVLSPSTEKIDRADKMPLYAKAGVRYAWMIHPLLRTLEVLRLGDGRWTLLETFKDNARFRAEPFDALELELAPLWGR
jgi:Uma2 family endonuclease